MNHAGPLRGRSSPAHLQPQGTSTAGRPSRCSWPSRVGGSCPCDPQCGLPTQNAKRFEQANPRPRPTPPATVLGSRGVAGGRAASAPPLLKTAVGAFRGRGNTTRKTRARASSLGGLRLGSTAKPRAAPPPFWPRYRSATLGGERQEAAQERRRACAPAKTR